MSIYKVIKNISTKKLGIYGNPTELPADARSADLAYVSSVGRLYVHTGTGWLPIISDNAVPTWLSKPAATETILIGNTFEYTLAYVDPENINGTFTYQLSAGSLGNNVLTTDNENFSIQAVEPATFSITFRASDTVNEIISTTAFTVRTEEWNVSTSTLNDNLSFANTYFGNSLAIDETGTYAIAGAYNYGSPSSSAGKVTFLKRNGTSWNDLGEKQSSDISLGDQFGYSVAINEDGTLAVVGAWAADTDSYINNGAVYVFSRTGDTWTQVHKEHGPAQNNAYFGKSVAIKNNTVFIGAPGYGTGGRVRTIITSDGGSTWTGGLDLQPDGTPVAGMLFGETLSVANGSDSTLPNMTVAVGSPGDSSSKGAVFIFDNNNGLWDANTLDGGGTILTKTKLTGSYDSAGDQFGSSLSILDGKLIVGVPYSDFNTLEGGLVYEFYYNTTNSSWTEGALIEPTDPANYDHFGNSVSLATNTEYPGGVIKDTVVVGARDKNAAYGYSYNTATSTYSQVTKIFPINISTGDGFGSAVAINGIYGLVGAINRDSTGGTSNVGEVFHINLG